MTRRPAEPEIVGEAAVTYQPGKDNLMLGGRVDDYANFEGKLDEIVVYNRALTPAEVAEHWRASDFASKLGKVPSNPKGQSD